MSSTGNAIVIQHIPKAPPSVISLRSPVGLASGDKGSDNLDVWTSGKAYGSTDGEHFNDINSIGIGAVRPKSIKMRRYTLIENIQMAYVVQDGTNPQMRAVEPHGGSGGVDLPSFTLDDDERVIRVTGRSGSAVDNLYFYTNKKRIYGGGGDGGNVFEESKDGYVLGWISGTAGKVLSQIKLHWIREEVAYVFQNMKYDIDKGIIRNYPPKAVTEIIGHNASDVVQTTTQVVTLSTSKTSNWSASVGLKAGISTTVSAGIPFVVEGKVKLSFEVNTSFTYGESKTTSVSKSSTISFTMPPRTKGNARMIVVDGECKVKFSGTLVTHFRDGYQQAQDVTGEYSGIEVVETSVEYDILMPVESKPQ